MHSALHERLQLVIGTRSYRALADLTACNPETVRRYMQGQAPSVEFLAALCSALEINGEWLLCGRGPMRVRDVRAHALKDASGTELLGALATGVEGIAERLERLEVYVQTLETRLRAQEQGDLTSRNGVATRPTTEPLNGTPLLPAPAPPASTRSPTSVGPPAPARAAGRARRIGEAVAQRSRPDAC